MTPKVPLRQALADPALLGTVLPGETWAAWRTLLIAAMGEPLTDEERETFTRLTGRPSEPLERVEELWGIVGRRGGKTRAGAVLSVYLAALCDHPNIAVGERPVSLFLGQNQKQAAVAFNYALGVLQHVPLLSELVTSTSADTISLTTGVDLMIRAASFRGLRGITCVNVIADEAAFWRDDTSANPDVEILAAIRPSLATTCGPLIVLSSPYARRGALYEAYRRDYGSDGDPRILVAHGASRDFNPSLPQRVVDRAMERDPAAASAEYLGQFRSDLEAFVSRDAIEAVVSPGVHERAPLTGVQYRAFCDPAGGNGLDSMTLAISHEEGSRAIVDLIRERKPPFSPSAVVAEFAADLKRYRLTRVEGDRYAGSWPAESFLAHGITYVPSAKPKSDIYRDLLPLLNSGRVDLLDHEKLVTQLCSLERRTSRGGRDSIDHAPGAHDDVANAVAGACFGTVLGLRAPVAASGISTLGNASWIDRLSPEEAVRRGYCSRERAVREGWIKQEGTSA
jgi:hypothetical protein